MKMGMQSDPKYSFRAVPSDNTFSNNSNALVKKEGKWACR